MNQVIPQTQRMLSRSSSSGFRRSALRTVASMRAIPSSSLLINKRVNIFRNFHTKFTPLYNKKPLSRVPVGGSESTSSSSKFKNSTLEFSSGKAMILFVLVGGTLYYFFEKEKRRIETVKTAEANRGYGKPMIGGDFTLYDENGKEFTEKDLLGKFSIIYFGFSHCPDICPDELDKLGVWLDELRKKYDIILQPIFITCDPARDSSEVLKEYLSDFHEGIIGLTGSYEQVKNCCKKYRVYFSTPPSVKPGQDYLVDHSIFFYLMDPEGQFVEALGQNYDEETGVEKIAGHVKNYIPEEKREALINSDKWYSFLFK
ncbi:SCO family protein NDAI_0G01830 [Naumovozyma dairenensis CBS 421]|uniref:Thioredoxin domain-containing protein n=1 Tax=Naumovozyma dairenensis (strain ATCC 10597 / BCRC 20456 / CBS 421 / NBRC 0211 / NRRL Y-12639) TaxID=1071378 RepID=G0WDU8_NAUDC|nr:hypothetical protein NDAI_0G01830 [Naumovozyma dairenensis CBS 421]CCD25959.2 hypothetical protein NDAI_0G01830 [Naumovozyma dairenensis CBS 421]